MGRGLVILAACIAALAGPASPAPAPNISYSVGVCDPSFPARCIKPTIDGSVVISAGVALSAKTTTAASSLVVPAARMLLGFTVTASTGGYLLIQDANTVAPDGAITPGGCFYVEAPTSPSTSTTVTMANTPLGTPLSVGLSVMFSSTGCFSKTAASAQFISVLYQ